MLALALTILLGCSQILWLSTLDQSYFVFHLITGMAFLVVYFKWKSHFSLWISVFAFSALYSMLIASLQKNSQLKHIPEKSVDVIAYIDDLPKLNDNSIQYSLTLKDKNNLYGIKKVLAYKYVSDFQEAKAVIAGATVEVSLNLKPNVTFSNPGVFDFEKWLFRHGYDATASIKNIKVVSNVCQLISCYINNLREKARFNITQMIESEKALGLVLALTLGDKSSLDFESRELFQKTGTAHMIVISGLHIGLVAWFGFLLGRMLFFLMPSQRINCLHIQIFTGFVLASFYALLSGFAIPAVRALVMLTLFYYSILKKSSLSRRDAWSLALIVILIWDPMSVLDPGFWLSFLAVAILLLAFDGRPQIHNKLINLIKAQWVIFLVMMPLLLYSFHAVNLLAPVINLIVLPLVSIVLVPVIFIALISLMISETVALQMYSLAETLCDLLLLGLNSFDHWVSSYKTFSLNGFEMTVLLLCGLLFILPHLLKFKWLALPLYLVFLNNQNQKLNSGEFEIDILDVGQGLSVIVKTDKHKMIYDTGRESRSGFNTAEAVVLPYLNNEKIKAIDLVMFSHEDKDHIGGRDRFLRQVNPSVVMTTLENEDFQLCKSGNQWTWDEVKFEILSPYNNTPYLNNNSSCVLKIHSDFGSVLLTGDIEDPVEFRLLKHMREELNSDVMLVPHHGSKTSSGLEFIKAVNPKAAINSSGYGNPFNHPHPEVLNSYKSNNIPVYDTQKSGMIRVTFFQENIVISEHRKANQKVWQVPR